MLDQNILDGKSSLRFIQRHSVIIEQSQRTLCGSSDQYILIQHIENNRKHFATLFNETAVGAQLIYMHSKTQPLELRPLYDHRRFFQDLTYTFGFNNAPNIGKH